MRMVGGGVFGRSLRAPTARGLPERAMGSRLGVAGTGHAAAGLARGECRGRGCSPELCLDAPGAPGAISAVDGAVTTAPTTVPTPLPRRVPSSDATRASLCMWLTAGQSARSMYCMYSLADGGRPGRNG